MEALNAIETTPPAIIGSCFGNAEEFVIGEIEPTTVVGDEKEDMETPPTTTDRGLKTEGESIINVAEQASTQALVRTQGTRRCPR